MKIVTSQLANKLPNNHELLSNPKVNPENYLALCSVLEDIKRLTIYDITTTQKYLRYTIINVKDHINRTGYNPLINHQKELNIDFIDITKLYITKNNSIITDCCGKKLNTQYSYPSHYLCNISILAKALGIHHISAFLVNI